MLLEPDKVKILKRKDGNVRRMGKCNKLAVWLRGWLSWLHGRLSSYVDGCPGTWLAVIIMSVRRLDESRVTTISWTAIPIPG